MSQHAQARLGLLMSGWVDPSVSMIDRSETLLDRIPIARNAGFSSVWVGQHILAQPWPMLDTSAFLGRITAVSEDMDVGGIYILPLANPLRLAETLLSLDILSRGHLIVAAIMGWKRQEFEMLGVPYRERVGRFCESLDLIRQLWTADQPVQ